jgi:large subunit ribosomal protein L17
MRHRFGNVKLKRDIGSRNSLFKNLTTSVILEERVITTVPKAKAIQPMVEKMITLAKRDTLHTRGRPRRFSRRRRR